MLLTCFFGICMASNFKSGYSHWTLWKNAWSAFTTLGKLPRAPLLYFDSENLFVARRNIIHLQKRIRWLTARNDIPLSSSFKKTFNFCGVHVLFLSDMFDDCNLIVFRFVFIPCRGHTFLPSLMIRINQNPKQFYTWLLFVRVSASPLYKNKR